MFADLLSFAFMDMFMQTSRWKGTCTKNAARYCGGILWILRGGLPLSMYVVQTVTPQDYNLRAQPTNLKAFFYFYFWVLGCNCFKNTNTSLYFLQSTNDCRKWKRKIIWNVFLDMALIWIKFLYGNESEEKEAEAARNVWTPVKVATESLQCLYKENWWAWNIYSNENREIAPSLFTCSRMSKQGDDLSSTVEGRHVTV